ncbi:protein cereblon homolog [Acanthaster planci]|uniref:Protein cereblon homolog n=1 Tax=Acanthaster planci TaxID=133434 RepID=A0A8B7Z722_ACAPL|nr:protein cereblon homolog [Acanthaster planci]XP_022101443.1 protein cereblon homolog [Acanthaster planci]
MAACTSGVCVEVLRLTTAVVSCGFLLIVTLQVVQISGSDSDSDEWEAFFLCRQCGHEVAKATDFIRQTSTLSLHQRNDTILGVDNVLLQRFKNPQGREFELITTRHADVNKAEQAFTEHSWFPAYSWRIATCPHCKAHLGWSFEPQGHKDGIEDDEEIFYGLILAHLIHQEYADSLLMMPKMYGR